MDLDLPFKVEYYTDDGFTSCSKCLLQFLVGDLRLAAMIQSTKHDGKIPAWFHERCFFDSHRPKCSDQICNFEAIKYDDQLKILMKIDSGKNQQFEQLAKKRANGAPPDPNAISNYSIEYSLSNEDHCSVCKERIPRNELRIKKIDYKSDIALKFGKEILWNHWHCFVMERERYGFKLSGSMLPGFESLQPAHMEVITESLPSQVSEAEAQKLIPQQKAEAAAADLSELELEELIAMQNAELVRVRDALRAVCTDKELKNFLVANDSEAVQPYENLLDRCADFLAHGALYKCQKCSNGDMMFTKHGYTCNAMVDEWVSCGNFEVKPLRLKCMIPAELKQRNFFATCEPKVEHRAVRPANLEDTSHHDLRLPQPKKGVIKTTTIKLRNGSAVDPKSKLHNKSRVYVASDGTLYSSVLGLTDIQKNKNSYYKIQVLESEGLMTKKFWLFTSWGRTGTDIGDSTVKQYALVEACAEFERHYQEQTGNDWKLRANFKRLPGMFSPIDVSYSEDIAAANTVIASTLTPQVGDLMKLLFNVQQMKTVMNEFKLDLQKLPLGKLSAKQLQSAVAALTELENAVKAGRSKNDLIGLSNKFFTLIPHNFGLEKAPILDTTDKINQKREMVDSLIDIQNAFAMMMRGNAAQGVNSFDAYYKQLNTELVPLDPTSEDFKLIQTYTQNTQNHGYKITIEEIFKVNRQGEEARYAPFKGFHNRMLLWHGSRTTNFASIISNGLKIAPMVHGSMFGRGIYFADMVSKSANYCGHPGQIPTGTGLLTLCEVALGTMWQLTQAFNVTLLQAGLHSVKGIGRTFPDTTAAVSKDGVIIPVGQPRVYNNAADYYNVGYPVPAPVMPTLLYNEYIVYDEAQVNMKYLVKVKFG